MFVLISMKTGRIGSTGPYEVVQAPVSAQYCVHGVGSGLEARERVAINGVKLLMSGWNILEA